MAEVSYGAERSLRAVTEVFEWLSALVSRQKVKGKPLKSVRDLNYARKRVRASTSNVRVHAREEDAVTTPLREERETLLGARGAKEG